MGCHPVDQVAVRSHCVQLADSDDAVDLTRPTVDDARHHHQHADDDDDDDDALPVVPPAQVSILQQRRRILRK